MVDKLGAEQGFNWLTSSDATERASTGSQVLPSSLTAEPDLISWFQQVLAEERRDLQQLLATRHEDILSRLQRQLLNLKFGDLCSSVGTAPQENEPSMEELQQSRLPAVATASASAAITMTNNKSDASASRAWFREEQPMAFRVSTEQTMASSVRHHMSRSDKIQNFLMDMDKTVKVTPTIADRQRYMKEFLHLRLDLVSAGLACLYVIFLAIQTQHQGIDTAHAISSEVSEFQGSRPATELWPGALQVFLVLEWSFGLFWSIELATRFLLNMNLWKDRFWITFDAVVILVFWLDQFDGLEFLAWDPAVVRVGRLFRLFRMLKLVRYVKLFDPLQVIIKSIVSAMSVLSWSIVVIFIFLMVVSVVNTSLLNVVIRDPSQDNEVRRETYMKWGTFYRSFVSMFEITLANWGPHCWFLVDNVSEAWGCFFVIWKCCFGFAVMQVIMSVFMQVTFKTANADADIMIAEKAKASQVYLNNLDSLFTELDEDGMGVIVREDFELALEQPRVRHWFSALEIDVSDGPKVFKLLDNGNGAISKAEFINGLRKVKGAAQSMDMIRVLKELEKISRALGDAAVQVGHVDTRSLQSVPEEDDQQHVRRINATAAKSSSVVPRETPRSVALRL